MVKDNLISQVVDEGRLMNIEMLEEVEYSGILKFMAMK